MTGSGAASCLASLWTWALTAGLVLAAGLGTRFGGTKLLAPIDGQPMLQHVLICARMRNLAPVVVVLGADADEHRGRRDLAERVAVRQPLPAEGISSSVRLGLSTLSRFHEAERAVVLLGRPAVPLG